MGAQGAGESDSQSSGLVFFDFSGTSTGSTESFTLFYPGPDHDNHRLEGSEEISLKALGLQALENARAARSGSLLGILEKEAVAGEEDKDDADPTLLLPHKDQDPDTKSDEGTTTCHIDHKLPSSTHNIGGDFEDDDDDDINGGLDEEDLLSVFGDEELNGKLTLLADMAGVDDHDGQPADVLLANVIMVLKDLEQKSSRLCAGFPLDGERFGSFVG